MILEFPSLEQGRRCYDSKEYAAIRAIRQASSRGEIVLLEGLEG